MKLIINDLFKTSFIALLLIVGIGGLANAQNAYFNENGYITINGKVEFVSDDEFTMKSNGERIDVQMEDLNRDTLENMIDADMIERGTYVSVTGRLGEEFGSPMIKASNVRVYNN